MGEVNITYETLFELLRREKTRDELQKLEPTFYQDVIIYLEEKQKYLNQQKNVQDLFADEERKKAVLQEENIRKILRELYERREKKIITMALDKSRAMSSVIDGSTLLAEEKEFYDTLLELFDNYRKGILRNMLMLKKPTINGKTIDNTPNEPSSDPEMLSPQEDPKEKSEEETTEQEEETAKQEQTKELEQMKIKILQPITAFVGTNLETHGPFETGQEITIEKELAKVLVNKGQAEQNIQNEQTI